MGTIPIFLRERKSPLPKGEKIMKHRTISFNIFLIVLVMGSFLLPSILQSQDESSPINFSGSTRLSTQYSSRQGINQQTPRNYWRWDLNPTLTIYGIPISMNFFLSSEQSGLRQNINRFSLSLVTTKLLRKVPVLSYFSRLCVGTCYPIYSPLTFSGVPVTGADIEFTPGIFYFAVMGGRTQKAIQGTTTQEPTYACNLLAGKIGLGKKESSHFYLTILHAWDDENSILPDSIFNVDPQENYLVGAEANLSLFEKRFRLEGELAVSMLTRDVQSAELDVDDVPSWLVDLVEPKVSSSIDYAYSVKSSLNLSNTKLSGAVKMVGPGFYSLGVPYLRNDELTYEARIKQSLWKRNVSVGSYIRRSSDNLIPWKRTTTISSAYGVNLSLQFTKLPYIQLNYAPYFQNNDIDVESLKIDNKTSLFSATTGYNHQFGDINSSTNFFFSTQNSKTKSGVSDYSTQTYSFNESLNFRFPLTLAGSVSLSNADYSRETSRIISFDFNGSYCAFKKWRNRIGLRLSKQEGENNKTGFYLNSSFPVWKIGDLNLQAEQNFFRDNVESIKDYDEFILRVTISRRW